ncbi:COG4315 family predicted lipoprotein [Streptomyces sp. CA-249302]|uniref:COG4315 family predicted lipoprotein n=1 Tax=Streptomyces sp. CA-249302 TaxID=3240058 RepID=UPI003D90F7D1
MRRLLTPLLTAAAVLCCLGAAPEPPPLTVMLGDSDTLGRVLTDLSGHTLYRYDLEATGDVECLAPCTDTRRPLLAEAAAELRLPPGIAGALGRITRPDGTGDQVTYDGSPLYTYTGDTQPAETDGVTLQWHAVRPRDAAR